MRKVRKLRHWKQRFDKNAKFIWRKPITWLGEQVTPGDPVPEDLENNPTKLRRFWGAHVIELAEFEEPDVQTGQKPAKAKKVEEPKTLLGSDALPSVIDVHGEEVPLGDVVALAFEHSGLTVEQWNEQDGEAREAALQQTVDWMCDLGNEEPEQSEQDDAEEPAEPAKVDDRKPEDLVTKETDRKWHVEGVEGTFPSKTKALEAAAELLKGDDAFLE